MLELVFVGGVVLTLLGHPVLGVVLIFTALLSTR
jgi:hypothetical protein